MSISIGTATIPDGSTSEQVIGPLTAAGHVTIVTDTTVWMATTAGLSVHEGAANCVMLQPGVPLTLSLAVGDTLYFGCPTGNGDVALSWIITA